MSDESRRPFDCSDAEIRLLFRLRQIAQSGDWDVVEISPKPLAIVAKRSSRVEQLDRPPGAACP